jgi:hypothetical protein
MPMLPEWNLSMAALLAEDGMPVSAGGDNPTTGEGAGKPHRAPGAGAVIDRLSDEAAAFLCSVPPADRDSLLGSLFARIARRVAEADLLAGTPAPSR